MPVQINKVNRRPSFAEQASEGLSRGAEAYSNHQQNQQKMQSMNQYGESIGIRNLGSLPPEIQKEAVSKSLSAQNDRASEEYKMKKQQDMAKEFSQYFQDQEQDQNPLQSYLPPESKVKPKGILRPEYENEVPERPSPKKNQQKKMIPQHKIIEASITNPASADKMQKWNDNILTQQKHDEKLDFQKEKEKTKAETRKEDVALKQTEQLRQETLPIRKELAEKANVARQSIKNKQHAKEVIERGDINDPTFAIFAEALPFNLGKRLLSNDTVEYKAGLVDDFRDISSIFKGATRVKEVEIFEDKIADIYLTDDQKLAILNSRINASKSDIIKAEVAAELEKEGKFYGALQFEEEVNKRAQPQMDALFNKILDEHASVIKDAENRKAIPLDVNDPEDKKIMAQLKKEAGGDSKRAIELGHKKGYKFKGVK